MAPASFRLDELAALLITRLEASRRAWIDDPERAAAEIKRITAEVAAGMAAECREMLGDEVQAARIEHEAIQNFAPRYTRLALAQNVAEGKADWPLLVRILTVAAAVIGAGALEELGLWIWLAPVLVTFFPEIQTAWSRRGYETRLQQIVTDLGAVQDSVDRLAVPPAPPLTEAPASPATAARRSTQKETP